MSRSPRPAAFFSAVVVIATIMALSVATPALALMSRTLVMSRAQTWVNAKIPYSQVSWADSAGTTVTASSLGWRKDCSGFVSMSWNTFKPGYSTRTLYQTATAITKEALQPGDALVSYNYHAVIFGGWVPGTDRTQYYQYQMGSEAVKGDGDGTRMRIAPYPSWYWPPESPYIPYRLNGIVGSIDYSTAITPIQGTDRYKTAVAASIAAFKSGATSVIVASGANWPDALGASALAGAVGGPVLLTQPGSLPKEVAAEIERLGATEVIVVGDFGAVSADVSKALGELPGVDTTRVAGADRYATSARIAEETVRRLRLKGTYDGTVFVTTGMNFPDALAASPLAQKRGWPILLTKPSALSTDAALTIAAIGADRALVLGSTSAISTQTGTSLTNMLGIGRVTRLAGTSRYTTGLVIADYGVKNCGLSLTAPVIATGGSFPDALAGGVMAGRLGTVLLLTPSACLDVSVADLLMDHASTVGKPRVLGGDTAIKPIVREAIALALSH